MPRVALVSHNRELETGRLQAFLDRHDIVQVWAPDRVFPGDVEAAVVMGGFMSAYDSTDHPWLIEEKRWLGTLVARDIPVLGICLGAQLLADALGGRAFPAPVPEVGVVPLEPSPEGRRHPVVVALGERAFFAHEDTFDLPPGATLLARTGAHPAVFSFGSALGIQPHPETTTAQALKWADHPRFDLLERAGVSRHEYVDQLREFDTAAAAAAEGAFGAWFDQLGSGGAAPGTSGSIPDR